MFYLLATILLNTLLSVIFKILPRFKVNTLQAIVVNYWVCVLTGSVFMGYFPISSASIHQNWFPWALLMGVGFISIFNLLAYCTRVDGITTATTSNKLSLVIPVIFSVILYSEHVGIIKIIGIILAFPAVYLTTRVKEDHSKQQQLLWPILLFIGSGLLDTLVKFVEHGYLPTPSIQAMFTVHTFATAGTIGVIIVSALAMLGKTKLQWRNVFAGICIGIPNYFSIYYFIRLLNSNVLQSSAAIPVNNIGILVTSSLTAILLFREKVTPLRILGLVLAIVAILLIAFGDMYGRGIQI